jgi:hypothetical protein
MGLNDLAAFLENTDTKIEEHLSLRITTSVLAAVEDSNGEVQNLAIKWY